MGVHRHTDAKAIAQEFEALADVLPEKTEEASEDAAKGTMMAADAHIDINNSVAYGHLRDSLYFFRNDVAGEPSASYTVRADKDYAPFVEYGTGLYASPETPFGPFKAPLAISDEMVGRIRQWIIRKGIIPHSVGDAGDPLHVKQEKLSYAIAQVLAFDGGKPHPFMRPAYDETKAENVSLHRIAIHHAIDDAFDRSMW